MRSLQKDAAESPEVGYWMTNIGSNKVAEKAGYIEVGEAVENDKALNVWSISGEHAR